MNKLVVTKRTTWQQDLLTRLSQLCEGTPFAHAFASENQIGIHLAIFVEPYLNLVLQGKKTIESRFGVTRQPPFKQVYSGDLLIIKKSGGPVCGVCRVTDVWFYHLDPKTWSEIEQHACALCMDSSPFWEKKKAAAFATLMQIQDVCCFQEFPIDKEDPRSWVIVKNRILGAQGTFL